MDDEQGYPSFRKAPNQTVLLMIFGASQSAQRTCFCHENKQRERREDENRHPKSCSSVQGMAMIAWAIMKYPWNDYRIGISLQEIHEISWTNREHQKHFRVTIEMTGSMLTKASLWQKTLRVPQAAHHWLSLIHMNSRVKIGYQNLDESTDTCHEGGCKKNYPSPFPSPVPRYWTY